METKTTSGRAFLYQVRIIRRDYNVESRENVEPPHRRLFFPRAPPHPLLHRVLLRHRSHSRGGVEPSLSRSRPPLDSRLAPGGVGGTSRGAPERPARGEHHGGGGLPGGGRLFALGGGLFP